MTVTLLQVANEVVNKEHKKLHLNNKLHNKFYDNHGIIDTIRFTVLKRYDYSGARTYGVIIMTSRLLSNPTLCHTVNDVKYGQKP